MEFYIRLASAAEPDLVELRRLVPRYFGTTRYSYGGHTQEYIMMEDLAQRMMEPCIMDVKIGEWIRSKVIIREQRFGECVGLVGGI